MKLYHIGLSVIAACLTLGACQVTNKETKTLIKPEFTENDMDLSVDPGSDFYEYANGGWRKQHPLPDDKSRFGSFDLLAEDNKKMVRSIIENAAAEKGEKGSINQKIGDFYAAGMDLEKINQAGFTPIQPLLDKINGISNRDELTQLIAYLQKNQLTPLFHFYSTADQKNSKMTIAGIYQSGLGMPDRDYYLEDNEASEKLRQAYKTYLTTLFTLVGNDAQTASELAEEVFAFETKLAEASNSRLDNRDPHKTYNKMGLAGLSEIAPEFQWSNYIGGLEINTPAEINVSQPQFIAAVADMYAKEELSTWKSFLNSVVLRKTASALSEDFVNANFAFYGEAMSGKKEQEPRWKTVLDNTNGALGEAVGQLFVAEYFPPAAKKRMDDLVENLRVGFGMRIDQLEWMSDETKKAAHEKLAAIRVKIGYPSKWRDYLGLEISNESYLANILSSNRFDFAFNMAKIGQAVDQEEWHMTPQTVNAYYNPVANEIVFPAAILQPPFFYLDGDDAVNYGAIGVVIGHEMTHGFDDKGRLYAKDGNLNNWWTEEDVKKFNERTQILVNQYNAFEVLPGQFADGELSLGENIADLGGLCISYQAYQNSLNGKENTTKIDGFSDYQRFFLAYSRVWAQNVRDKEIARLTKVDVHSLGDNRVNGPLPNMEEFYAAFNIEEKSPMYIAPENRASIW
ncbi:M13 family metallopeptidase [Carboxylicivirga sp. N1Y90]|uniref:M13 family metallopeptidase n=1 Tax=Carboxylicivirga fragile TaxID=3417571 RepID=UPI003D33EA7A|nr:M13 family metallopeptidase [Marinilabiliaceae bacterium N1Y90]